MSFSNPIPHHSSEDEYDLHALIVDHLERKEELFQAVNGLVNQLYHTQMLLEENKCKEALLTIEQLVHYGETITRQF